MIFWYDFGAYTVDVISVRCKGLLEADTHKLRHPVILSSTCGRHGRHFSHGHGRTAESEERNNINPNESRKATIRKNVAYGAQNGRTCHHQHSRKPEDGDEAEVPLYARCVAAR